jgi:hypothetical protein
VGFSESVLVIPLWQFFTFDHNDTTHCLLKMINACDEAIKKENPSAIYLKFDFLKENSLALPPTWIHKGAPPFEMTHMKL